LDKLIISINAIDIEIDRLTKPDAPSRIRGTLATSSKKLGSTSELAVSEAKDQLAKLSELFALVAAHLKDPSIPITLAVTTVTSDADTKVSPDIEAIVVTPETVLTPKAVLTPVTDLKTEEEPVATPIPKAEPVPAPTPAGRRAERLRGNGMPPASL